MTQEILLRQKKGMNSKSTSITTTEYQPLKIVNSETIVIEDFIRTSKIYGLNYTFDVFNKNNDYTTIYANTIYRQTESNRDNKQYFKDLRKKIKQTLSSSKTVGWRMTYLKYYLLDIGYYPLLIITPIFRKYQTFKNQKSWK